MVEPNKYRELLSDYATLAIRRTMTMIRKLTGAAACAVLLATIPLALADNHADDVFDAAARVAELEGTTDGSAWLLLGRDARNAGDFETAEMALDKAEETGFSPPSVNFERARLAVAGGDPDAAEDVLQGMIDSGFTGLNFMINDPVVGSLAGRSRFDEMVGALEKAAYPCEHQEGFRDFDFWVGEWIVHTSAGQHAGNNTITANERGCVLIENWTDIAGGTGMSINYLDKLTGEWVQVWHSAAGSQIHIRGGLTDDGMAMEGTIHYVASGTSTPFRALWTPLEDGRVRQYFEHSTDGGETWISWFEGFYSRVDKEG